MTANNIHFILYQHGLLHWLYNAASYHPMLLVHRWSTIIYIPTYYELLVYYRLWVIPYVCNSLNYYYQIRWRNLIQQLYKSRGITIKGDVEESWILPAMNTYVTCNTHQMREDYTLLYTANPKLCVSNGCEDTRLLLNLCAHTKS